MEACKIIITQEVNGTMNVSAPMAYKELCYNILDDAKIVINTSSPFDFFGPSKTLLITMNMTGLVDVAAPMPDKEWCLMALKAARKIIDEFESNEQKQVKSGYADSISSI
jgi:hypothetical protein